MTEAIDAAADLAAITKLFRLTGLDSDALSDEQLDERARLVKRHPEAWLLAQRLGPYHPSEPEYCPGLSWPVTIH
jgi:hypothetical protein